MCTPYIESQKMVAMATSLSCRVSEISAFSQQPLKPASIINCLVTIVQVIAILVPKLVAMATSLSTSGLPSNT